MQAIDLDQHRKDAHDRAPQWAAARRVLGQAIPPERVEAELLRRFARQHSRLPWYRRWSHDATAAWAGIGTIGCALALVVAGVHSAGMLRPAPQDRIAASVAGDGFLSIVPPERMAAAVHSQLRRADLPRQVLVQLGVPIADDAPDELIHTELLVASTGEPLAIRLAVN